MTGSYYKVDASDKFSSDGYLLTGDLGTFDSNGLMQVLDRKKDMLKSGGEWISSIDLENHIMGLSNKIKKACVVGAFHPKWMQRPIAIIELQDNQTVTLDEVRKYCIKDNKFTKWQCPDDIIFMDIPLTGTGKMSKKDVRKILKDKNYQLPSLRKKSKL